MHKYCYRISRTPWSANITDSVPFKASFYFDTFSQQASNILIPLRNLHFLK